MATKLETFNLCEICGKPISDNTLCFECLKIKKKAQEYAIANNSTTEDISEQFGIDKNLLNKWVNRGDFWCIAPCRSCGQLVKGGNICAECRYRFKVELGEV